MVWIWFSTSASFFSEYPRRMCSGGVRGVHSRVFSHNASLTMGGRFMSARLQTPIAPDGTALPF
jgi:hypothetical protein